MILKMIQKISKHFWIYKNIYIGEEKKIRCYIFYITVTDIDNSNLFSNIIYTLFSENLCFMLNFFLSLTVH